jgi:hypothetical protein
LLNIKRKKINVVVISSVGEERNTLTIVVLELKKRRDMPSCDEKLIIDGKEVSYCIESQGHEGNHQGHYQKYRNPEITEKNYIKTVWWE